MSGSVLDPPQVQAYRFEKPTKVPVTTGPQLPTVEVVETETGPVIVVPTYPDPGDLQDLISGDERMRATLLRMKEKDPVGFRKAAAQLRTNDPDAVREGADAMADWFETASFEYENGFWMQMPYELWETYEKVVTLCNDESLDPVLGENYLSAIVRVLERDYRIDLRDSSSQIMAYFRKPEMLVADFTICISRLATFGHAGGAPVVGWDEFNLHYEDTLRYLEAGMPYPGENEDTLLFANLLAKQIRAVIGYFAENKPSRETIMKQETLFDSTNVFNILNPMYPKAVMPSPKGIVEAIRNRMLSERYGDMPGLPVTDPRSDHYVIPEALLEPTREYDPVMGLIDWLIGISWDDIRAHMRPPIPRTQADLKALPEKAFVDKLVDHITEVPHYPGTNFLLAPFYYGNFAFPDGRFLVLRDPVGFSGKVLSMDHEFAVDFHGKDGIWYQSKMFYKDSLICYLLYEILQNELAPTYDPAGETDSEEGDDEPDWNEKHDGHDI